MKSTRAREFRDLSPDELQQKHEALRTELSRMQLKSKTVGVEKPAEFGRIRKDIARILTVLREKPQ